MITTGRALFLLIMFIIVAFLISAMLNYAFENIDPMLDLVLSIAFSAVIMQMTTANPEDFDY